MSTSNGASQRSARSNSPMPADDVNHVPGLSPLDADADQAEMPIDLETFLRMAVAQGVSDIHLRAGFPPVLRKDGDMVQTRLGPLTEQAINLFAKKIIPPRVLPLLKNRLDFDFGFLL